MKSVKINGVVYTMVTAIATECGDTTRQRAILVHDEADTYGDGDCLYFGYDELPKTEDEARTILEEPWPDHMSLDTIELI